MVDPSFIPPLLALVAAFWFGATVVFARRGMQFMTPFAAARVSIAVTFVFFAALAPFTLRWGDFLSPWIWLFAVLGIFQPLLSMFLSFVANRRLGPTISATVSSTSPLFAMVGAVALLGEQLTPNVFLGTLGVMCGVILLTWQGEGTRKWALTALWFAVACAAIRGFGNLVHRFGMSMLPLPVMAGLVTYGVSFTLGTVLHWVIVPLRGLRVGWAGVPWLVAAGLGNGVAMYAMISALRDGIVLVIVPIVGAFPLFTLLVSLLWFRQERITPRVLAGVLLIVPSVAVIGLRG